MDATPIVLLVEDDRALGAAIEMGLELAGFVPLRAESARQALRQLENRHVDLVLTDLMMPGEDGVELIRRLHEKAPELPVVAMSGGGAFGERSNLEAALDAGAAATIEKPFSSAKLKQTLNAVIEAQTPARR